MKLLEAPTGLPLGLGGGYDEQTYPWHSGGPAADVHTDGLSEARDQRGEFLPLPLLPGWFQPMVSTTPWTTS